MDELIKLVAKKTGLPEAKAKIAVETVLNFIKEKLPEPLGSQIDNLLGGGDLPTDLLQGLGGLFGGKK
ncbi:MAG: hypothetical protein JW726_14620 [Anaerolineales bacterium]|nr:hypothetical protein [Anaerolineales bacterium]